MNRTTIVAGKAVVGTVWAYCLACFFAPSLPLAATAQLVAIVMGAAHVVELAIFRNRWVDAPGSTAGHVAQILLFGMFHAQALALDAADRQSTSPD